MSIIAANPCTQKGPTVWTLNSLSDLDWIKTPNDGDVAFMVVEGGAEFWVYRFPYIGQTDDFNAIPAACRGAWLRSGDAANVRIFGAVGDGITDDTDAIEAAVASLLVSETPNIYSGALFFPPGRYRYTRRIAFENTNVTSIWGVMIFGASVRSTTLYPDGCDGIFLSKGDNYTIANLFIEQAQPTGNSGVVIDRMTHVSFDQIDIYGFEDGVLIPGDGGSNNSHSIDFCNCTIRNCTNGLRSDGQAINALRFGPNNEVRDVNVGVWVSGASILISGNTIEACSSVGIRIGSGTSLQVSIVDNYMEAIGPSVAGSGSAIEQGFGNTACIGLKVLRNFYNKSTGGIYGGATFFRVVGVGTFIDEFQFSDNNVYPSFAASDIDLSASVGYSGNTQSWGQHAVRSRNTFAGVLCNSDSADAASRNWFVGSNVSSFGDFAIVASAALGGNPMVGGVRFLEIFPNNIVNINDPARVTAGSSFTFAGWDYYTGSLNAAARNWFSGSNVIEFGDFAFVQSNVLGGDPKTAGTVRGRFNAAGTFLVSDLSASSSLITEALRTGIRTVTGPTSVLPTDFTLLADTSGSGFSIQLPDASTVTGQIFAIKKISVDLNTLTLNTLSGNIDGAVSKATSTQWDGWVVQSDGSDYFIVSQFI